MSVPTHKAAPVAGVTAVAAHFGPSLTVRGGPLNREGGTVMRRRTILLAAATVAFTFAPPAGAAEAPSGSVVARATIGTEEVTAHCAYVGIGSGVDVTCYFAGAAAASSTTTNQPYETSVTCRMVSPTQGFPGSPPTVTAGSGFTCPGAACATNGTTGPWVYRPVRICVSASAVFYPAMVTRTLGETCSSEFIV